MTGARPRRFLCACALAIFAAPPSEAQNTFDSLDAREITEAAEDISDSEFGFAAGSVFAAPIPLSNPTVGNGLIVLGGYLFKTDEGSSTSFLGAGGLWTNNGTNGYAIAGRLAFDDDRWKITAGLLDAELFYDFFVGPVRFPIEQDGQGALLDLGFGLTKAVTLGLTAKYLTSEIRPTLGILPDRFPPIDASLEIGILGVYVGYDTTDDDLFPREGIDARVSIDWGEVIGGDREFTSGVRLLNAYVPLGERNTWASRLALCDTSDETPFFLQCSLGPTDAFRGFESFRFRGTSLASLQTEFRGRIGQGRFGYTVFAGVGDTAQGFGALGSEGWRGAAGVGGRFALTRKFPLDLSVDVALNSEGETISYLYVGQAF